MEEIVGELKPLQLACLAVGMQVEIGSALEVRYVDGNVQGD